MASKTFLLLALVFVVVLLVSSQIADAKDLNDAGQVEVAKYGGGGHSNGGGLDNRRRVVRRRRRRVVRRRRRCHHGCCGLYHGSCKRCCSTFAEATAYKQAHEAQTHN